MPPEPAVSPSNHEKIASYAQALAHPVRIAILKFLDDDACCFHGDMAQRLPIAQSTLSQHLNVLKKTGLIKGEIAPPRTKYCINIEAWNEAKSLFSDLFK